MRRLMHLVWFAAKEKITQGVHRNHSIRPFDRVHSTPPNLTLPHGDLSQVFYSIDLRLVLPQRSVVLISQAYG